MAGTLGARETLPGRPVPCQASLLQPHDVSLSLCRGLARGQYVRVHRLGYSRALDGHAARRETDVSDNFLDSAWYFLRYFSHDDETQPWDPDLLRKWLPVDMYIGGAEHSVLHLMYVRFLTMSLHDLGHLEFEEPFKRFRANGMITKDGAKISKSKGNIVNPDSYITRFVT